MSEEITVREFQDDDQSGVLDLMRLSLGETEVLQRSPELFSWKHQENPFGASLLLVAQAGEEIVGLRAFMRWELHTTSEETIRCVRAVDTATHPAYHRRGIFRNLTNAALEIARDQGVHLVFNTPNQASGPGYLKMGWIDVGSIGVFVRPRVRLALRRRSPSDDGINTWIPGHRSELADWPRDRSPRGLRTIRTPAYLDWRFRSHPTAIYSVLPSQGGKLVMRSNLRRGKRELVVSDLIGDIQSRDLASTVRRSSADYAVAWFSARTPERRILIKSRFVPIPGMKALRLMARPLSDLPCDISDPGAWDIGLGDLELL